VLRRLLALMPTRLLALNVLLGGVSLACAAFIVWEQVAPAPTPQARPRPAAPAAAPARPPEAPRPPASAYTVVATRNVFSSSRTEAPVAAAAGAAVAVVKPNLHGVVLRDQNPIAYLEDPLTKRVAGYRVGDSIAGGTVKTIAADRVEIARPEGTIDVKLRDPSKPRPAAPAAAPAAAPPAGVPIPAPGGVAPGFPAPPAPGPAAQPAPRVQLEPGAPGTMVGPFMLPGRRPSPSLGNRLPLPPLGATPSPAPQAPQR
jgi:hypothetical protein